METEEEARSRIAALQKATNMSKEIDQYLLEGKKDIERRRKAIKIMLLGTQTILSHALFYFLIDLHDTEFLMVGQSESGKVCRAGYCNIENAESRGVLISLYYS